MKRIIILLFAIASAFVIFSCCEVEVDDFTPPKPIKSVTFSPSTVKSGDILTLNLEVHSDLDFNTDFKINNDGQIKYIGNNQDYLSLDKELSNESYLAFVCPDKNKNNSNIELKYFLSIKQEDIENSIYKTVLMQVKIPENIKTGYVWVTVPLQKYDGIFSDEKIKITE